MQENAVFVATDMGRLAACTALCSIGVGKQSHFGARRRTANSVKWKVGRSLEEALRNGMQSQTDGSKVDAHPSRYMDSTVLSFGLVAPVMGCTFPKGVRGVSREAVANNALD
jgi:hypothetical protein